MNHRREVRPKSGQQARIVVNRRDGRTIVVRPWIAGLGALMLAALSIAYLGATAYLVFRDDLVNAVFARNAALQHAYEDRIALLRSEIDKIASRQILDQVAFDEKVDRLLAAHLALQDRSRVVTDLIDRARADRLIDADPEDRAALSPAVTGYAPDTAAAAEDAFAPLTAPRAERRHAYTSVPRDGEGRPDLKALARNLTEVDRAQTEAIHAIAAAAEARAATVTGIVAGLGVKLALPEAAAPDVADATALGGPYIPMESSEAMAAALADVSSAYGTLGSLKSAVSRLPLGIPVAGAPMSSNFGSRKDPFLGSAAFHAGIDFRAPSGRAVKATAAGTVLRAGRAGGYGNLVEIDHGKGVTTRYAHLSRVDVKAGQRVAAGETVGRVGSTGRSTGPHLHYETRVRGSAVNPQSYLSAGNRIARLLP